MEHHPPPNVDLNDDKEADESPYKRTGPRVVYSELTGMPSVSARPGAPLITSEMVREWLEDFP